MRREVAALEAAYAANGGRLRARLAALGVPRADLEDARQEVFLVAIKRSPALESEVAAAAWLNRVSEYVALAHRRKAYRRREVVGAMPELGIGVLDADPAERASERLHAALATLSPLERDLVALHLAADVPFRTLAALHGCDVKTVRKRFQSAARRLRRTLATEAPLRVPLVPHALVGGREPQSQLGFEAASYVRFGSTPSVSVGIIGNVAVTAWRGPLTAASLELLLGAGRTVTAQYGPRMVCLSSIEPEWPVPRFEERQRIFEAFRFLNDTCNGMCLWGAAPNLVVAEQIVRALGFLLRASYDVAASRRLEDGVTFALAHGALAGEPAQLAREKLLDAAERTRRCSFVDGAVA